MGTSVRDNFPHYVYRVYDGQDRLLYIGCTVEVGARMAVHRSFGNKSEASFVIGLIGDRVESVQYPNRAAAREAEREAIKAEAPLLNREHNPTRWVKTSEGWVQLSGPTVADLLPKPDPEFQSLVAGLLNRPATA